MNGWKDNWLPSTFYFLPFVPRAMDFASLKFSNLIIMDTREWDENKVKELFALNDHSHILRFLP